MASEMDSLGDVKGLSNRECLEVLYDQISKTLGEFKSTKYKTCRLLKLYFKRHSLEFIHNILIFICSLGLFISYDRSSNVFPNFTNAITLLVILIVNLGLCFHIYFKTVLIMVNKVTQLNEKIQHCLKSNKILNDDLFADVCMSSSSSISCQLAIRDGKLVNLPLNLIVHGDVILLRPGDTVNVNCRSLEKNQETGEYVAFERGKTYDSFTEKDRQTEPVKPSVNRLSFYMDFNEALSSKSDLLNDYLEMCALTSMSDCLVCVALETPYIAYLTSILSSYQCDSDSIFSSEFSRVRQVFLYILIPIVLILQTCISTFYFLIFRGSLMENNFNKIFWTNIVYVLLPLLPISFTLFWKLTVLHGTVCFLKTYKCLKKLVINSNPSAVSELTYSQTKTNRLAPSSSVVQQAPACCDPALHAEEKLELLETKRSLEVGKEGKLASACVKPSSSQMTNSGSNCNQMNVDIESMYNGNGNGNDRSINNELNLETNLNQDDMSEINDLSSIDSLLAQMPAGAIVNKKENYFSKLMRNLRFYFKIVRSILFNRCESSSSKHKPTDFEDLQNAPFIYYSNFLVGLGIITNFSCIDKTGVLSWPNPTAEKIWLFSQAGDVQSTNSAESAEYQHGGGADEAASVLNQDQPTTSGVGSSAVKRKSTNMSMAAGDKEPEKCHLETYNLTHDNANGYKLEFDDPNWSNNLNTLKPLGLSILLNTCNRDLIKNYKKFHDLLKLESFQAASKLVADKDAGGQMNTMTNLNSSYGSSLSTTDDYFEVKSPYERRCLCQISRIIGFNEASATKSYEVMGTNSIYRNLEIKPLSKLKPKQVIMSDLYSVVANCSLNGIKNLYSQGSPDLVLDFCSDFWNGKVVEPFSRNQRKKLLDLYQRYSASSYCTAFSYKPLLPDDATSGSTDSTVGYELNSNKALRLPASYGEKLSAQTGFLNHYDEFLLSTSDSDSSSVATLDWEKQSYDQAYRSPQDKRSLVLDSSFNLDTIQTAGASNDAELIQSKLLLHTNQIFLGMISMQYRAKIDVIKLVEKLTKSCVRFVHFSSDNEQISRAFAEILGLDTGWNCDISLAPDTENRHFPKAYDESYRGVELVDEMKAKSSKSLEVAKPKSRPKLTVGSRNNKKPGFLRPINSKFKKFNANYLRLNLKKTVYQSLPSLKFNVSKGKLENESHAVNLNSSQIVKFDLSNVNKESLEEDDEAANKASSPPPPTPKNRKLSSQSSIQSDEARNSLSVRNKKISSNSSSLAVLSAIKVKRSNSNILRQVEAKQRANELNVSKLSVSSSKSNSFRQINKQFKKKKKRKSVDESSSHRTLYSSRTLSETEVLENAAQLPRGVENIRRHLDNEIDNVPLHVSLFTDSTKPAVIEMVKIMKDYGEVVCCFGSSHSIENNDVFAAANVSIGVEPLYPLICTARHPGRKANSKSTQQAKSQVNHNRPINSNPKNALFDLSVFMNTLSCGLNLKHEDLCMLPPLIALAREMVYSYRIAIVFMLMCNLSVSIVQLICNTLFLPPILSGFQVLFLILFTIPLLSYSLIHKNESNDLRCSTKKNRNLISRQDVREFCIKFLFKFFPSMCILVGFHFMSLYFECKLETKQKSDLSHVFNETADITGPDKKFNCHLFAFDIIHLKQNQSNSYNYWSNRESVQFSQLFNHFFISIYFVFLSLNHVCIEKSIWSYVPFRNKTWTKMVIIVFVIHLLYLVALLLSMERTNEYFKAIPLVFWVVTGLWPVLLIVINEIYKVFEIREILRQYKKLRLDFDTKLGLNSPFV